eukprot:3081989-Prymnesium_polylepis.1
MTVAEHEVVCMTRGARERFRSTPGDIIAAVATEGRGETASGDLAGGRGVGRAEVGRGEYGAGGDGVRRPDG